METLQYIILVSFMYVSLLVYGTSVFPGRQLLEGSQSTMLFEMPEQLFPPLILCILAPYQKIICHASLQINVSVFLSENDRINFVDREVLRNIPPHPKTFRSMIFNSCKWLLDPNETC